MKTILRTGFLTNSTGVTEVMPEKKLVGSLFTPFRDGQSPCWTIDRAEATTRAFFFINAGPDVLLGPNHLQ